MKDIDKISLEHFKEVFITKSDNENLIDLILKSLEHLKPLEDLYRKENPKKDGKLYIPDATTFYKWITNKILQNENLERD